MSANNAVKKIRIREDLSQEEMASTLNVTANYISLIENNKKKPGMPFLKNVSKIYDIPLLLLTRDILIPEASNRKEKEMRNRVIDLINDLENLVFGDEEKFKEIIKH